MNKTIISITALIALGCTSAFADGTLRYGLVFDNSGGSSSLANIAVAPGSGTITQSGYVNWTANGQTTLDGTIAHTLGNTNWSIALDGDISTTNGFTLVLNAYATDPWKDFVSFTVGGEQYKFETGGSSGLLKVYHSTGENVAEQASLDSGFTFGEWRNIALTVSGSDYELSLWDSSGAKVSSVSFTAAEGNLTGLYSVSNFSAHTSANSMIDNVGLYDGVLTDDQLSQLIVSEVGGSGMIQSFPAVPEPSAFGLLSGVGVLALVAARRRRSGK